jgi:hypothetical protein
MQALDVNSTTEKAKAILRGERAVQSADNTLAKPIPHFDVDISIDEAKPNEDTTAATIRPILQFSQFSLTYQFSLTIKVLMKISFF